MAKNLRAIRKRIVSIKNTQQITKAMKMVASAKFKRAQDRAVGSRPYLGSLDGIAGVLLARCSKENFKLLERRDEEKRVAVLLYTSNRGLCGSFNSNLIRHAEDIIKGLKEEGKEVILYHVGKKGYVYFKKRKYNALKFYEGINNTISLEEAGAIAVDLMDGYVAGEFDRVVVIHGKFHSAASSKPYCAELLPLVFEDSLAAAPVIFEPRVEALVEEFLPLLIKAKIFNAVLESFASEHGARMTAMEAATSNAGELLKKMTLVYNKARQAIITQELIEIMGSVEAQSNA